MLQNNGVKSALHNGRPAMQPQARVVRQPPPSPGAQSPARPVRNVAPATSQTLRQGAARPQASPVDQHLRARQTARKTVAPSPSTPSMRQPSSQGMQRPANRIPGVRPATSSTLHRQAARGAVSQARVPLRPSYGSITRPGTKRPPAGISRQPATRPSGQVPVRPSFGGLTQRTGVPGLSTAASRQPTGIGAPIGHGTIAGSGNSLRRHGSQRAVSLRPGTNYYCPPMQPTSQGPLHEPSVRTPEPSPWHPSATTSQPSPRQPQYAPQPAKAPAKVPCHRCGLSRGACTTLNRFPFNSAHLSPQHKQQIGTLAQRILRENANTIVATGHTDKVGTDSYNMQLGGRRADAVIKELRRQLHLLKPGVQRNIFWRLVTKGESQPVSKTDVSLNRRVHVCVKKVKI